MSSLSRILVVEDEILLLLDLVDGLADHGIEAVPVTSARGAASLLDSDIGALVTDIELPGGRDGLQLAHMAARRRPGLPVVVVSGGVRPTPQQMPPGAAFLPKPYRLTDILAALERQIPARAA